MSVFECRGCGALYKSNGKPDKCEACGGPTGNRPTFHRIDDVDELLS